jgi:hypothetical protein
MEEEKDKTKDKEERQSDSGKTMEGKKGEIREGRGVREKSKQGY